MANANDGMMQTGYMLKYESLSEKPEGQKGRSGREETCVYSRNLSVLREHALKLGFAFNEEGVSGILRWAGIKFGPKSGKSIPVYVALIYPVTEMIALEIPEMEAPASEAAPNNAN